jgi:17beta-estradiol 17-dehydrogenase / very-long-chain 3-oxoacyl-CoA reductase
MELMCALCYVLYFLPIMALYSMYKYFLRPAVNFKKFGEWAVVTGATDGIGKAVSFELAKKGLNIVLISRTESKLKDVAAQIENANPSTKTMIVPVDYSNFDTAAQARVKAVVDGLDVAVLVNNVGQSYSYPQFLNEVKDDEFRQLCEMNVASTVLMTQIVLPGMEATHKGIIVNMSSGSSMMGGCPLLSLYAASKAYINEFSTSLHYEYSGSKNDIRVQAQTPFFVTSKLSKLRKANFSTPNPEKFAKASVRAMGHEPLVSPFWVHALMESVMGLLPNFFLMGKVRGMHVGLRKRALEKQNKPKAN